MRSGTSGCPAGALVYSCYEAGRDGFWLHRYLVDSGIINVIVDSSSIEVNRRRRRTKTDRLDACKLVTMLIRAASGEKKVWSVVNVPTPIAEDQRQVHRELLHRPRGQDAAGYAAHPDHPRWRSAACRVARYFDVPD